MSSATMHHHLVVTAIHCKALKHRQACTVKERLVFIREFSCAVAVEGGNGEAEAH